MPLFKATTLPGQVAESIEHAKGGSMGYIVDLMNSNAKNPDKVLYYFEKRSNDKNEDVKYAVLIAASCVRTKKSLRMLIALVSDQDEGNEAVATLCALYSSQQLVSDGGEKLRTALIKNFSGSIYSDRAVLLLQLFGRKRMPVTLLKRRLHSYEKGEHKFESVCINLALCELRDGEATGNIARYFDQKQIPDLILLLNNIKFIHRKAILLRAVSLLKDKRNARETGFPGGPPQHTRLCDEAMEALLVRFEPNHKIWAGSTRRFTSARLASAYNKYIALLKSH